MDPLPNDDNMQATTEAMSSVTLHQLSINPYSISPKDQSILYVAGHLISLFGLLYLDLFCPDTTSLLLFLFQGACGFLLLLTYVVLSFVIAGITGMSKGPDDHPFGEARAGIGAMIGVTVAILVAVLSHALEEKSWIYQIFWIQLLAFPSAYLAGHSSRLGDMVGDEHGLIIQIASYTMANSLLWFHLENKPGKLRPNMEAGILWQWSAWLIGTCLLFTCSVTLVCVITGRIIDFHLSDNPRAILLVIIGSLSGMFVMWLIIEFSDTLLHPTIMHKLLLTCFGVLPGTYLVGTLPG